MHLRRAARLVLGLLSPGAVAFETLAQLVVAYGYALVFVAIALECAALPIPGELLLLTFGGLSVQGRLDPALGIVVATLAVIAGDSIAFWAGRLSGTRVLARVRLGERWTPRGLTIVFGRFVVGARVLVAPMAGARRQAFGTFLAFDAVGAVIWSALFVLLGYGAGANVAVVQRHFTSIITAVEIALATGVGAYVAARLLRWAAPRPNAIGGAIVALILTLRS